MNCSYLATTGLHRWLTLGILILLLCPLAPQAEENFPKPEWKDSPNPIASTEAVIGGQIAIFAGQYPKSLNYYLDNNSFTVEVFGAMYENLLSMHPISLEYEPGLASSWIISDDKKTFTFTLDKKARWSDGRPITAHDVKWTFDTILDPKNLTGPHKVSLERFESPQVLDTHVIRFQAKDVHWLNLGAAGGFHILPKHAFENMDFNKINFEFPVVSGLYRIDTIKEGLFVTLKRRQDWWNKDAQSSQYTGNFDILKFKFYAERENAFEAFKKGQIDLYPIYTSRIWVKESQSDKISNSWIVKQKIFNKNPIGFQGFAMNMRKPPFDDIRVRKAMAHLLDRPKMNSTLMYNQYFLHKSYYEDLYDNEHPCPNELVAFDKTAARKLLHEAGYRVNPETGYLERDGVKFSFKFLTRSASSDKFLAIYAEDLKDVGIELIIDRKDWAAWARDMDEFNYEMTWAAWGAGVFKNPESMWASKEADRKSGNNITGFKHETVDQLIEKQKSIFDINKRNAIYRQIDKIIYDAHPYVLLWNIDYTRLLYWNKFGTPDTVLSKYGDETSAYWYWWIDEYSEADLEEAMSSGLPLPPKEPSIYFDENF